MSTMLNLNTNLITYLLVALLTVETLNILCQPHGRLFVLALPITSKPLESTAENLAWQAWLMLPPEEKNQVKSRKVTPKSIFILPLRGQCPPNHHKVNSKCIPIISGSNSLLIDPNILSLVVGEAPEYDYDEDPISAGPLQPNIDDETQQNTQEDIFDVGVRRHDQPSHSNDPLSSERMSSSVEDGNNSQSNSQHVDEPLKFSIFETRFPTTDYETNDDYLNISDENLPGGIESQGLQSLNNTRGDPQWPSTANNSSSTVAADAATHESIPDSIAFQVNGLASGNLKDSDNGLLENHPPCHDHNSTTTTTETKGNHCTDSSPPHSIPQQRTFSASQSLARVIVLDNDASSTELVNGEHLSTVDLDELLRNEALMPIVSLNRSSSLPSLEKENTSLSRSQKDRVPTQNVVVAVDEEVGATTNPPDVEERVSDISDVKKMLDGDIIDVGMLEDRGKREEEYELKVELEAATTPIADESSNNNNDNNNNKDGDNGKYKNDDYDLIMTTIIPPAIATTIPSTQTAMPETVTAKVMITTTTMTATATESQAMPFTWLRAGQADRTVHGEDVHLINGLAGIDVYNDDVEQFVGEGGGEEVLDESVTTRTTPAPIPTTTLRSTSLSTEQNREENETIKMAESSEEIAQSSEFVKYLAPTSMENERNDDDLDAATNNEQTTVPPYMSDTTRSSSEVTSSAAIEKTSAAYAGDDSQSQGSQESTSATAETERSAESSRRSDKDARGLFVKFWSKLRTAYQDLQDQQDQAQAQAREH